MMPSPIELAIVAALALLVFVLLRRSRGAGR
jgi:preprotein translocase subunit SecG